MKRAPVVILLALLLGFALGYLAYQRLHRQHNTITMMLAPYSGKLIPHVHDGDVLQWDKYNVTFIHGGGLCEGSESNISSCTVKKGTDRLRMTFFKLICASRECSDPDVGGGSDVTGLPPDTVSVNSRLTASTACTPSTCFEIDIFCQNQLTMVEPSDNASNPVSKGQRIFWVPNGSEAASGYTAGPDLSSVCGVSQFSSYQNPCTVQSGTPARTQYSVTVPTCQAKPVTAYVNAK